MSDFTHLTEDKLPHMVSVGEKGVTLRVATAAASIQLPESLLEMLKEGSNHKGPILHTCVLAGIQAVKKTSDAIPLCHPLPIDNIKIDPTIDELEKVLTFFVTVKTEGKTGVEMEALHGASIASLTFYDMVKSQYKDLSIKKIQLLEKSGGKSGYFKREDKS